MISIDEKKVEALILQFDQEIQSHANEMLRNLQNNYHHITDQDELRYLQELQNAGKLLITADRSNTTILINKFTNIIDFSKNKSHQHFRKQIVKDLLYAKRRGDFYPTYFSKLGIRCCVYCNAQLCITIKRKKQQAEGRFQVDHYLPKSDYPFLSISLYNLYPVCACCNNKKKKHRLNFRLYDEQQYSTKSKCTFSIVNHHATIARYLTNKGASQIKIRFQEPPASKRYKSLESLFGIEYIYNTQTDVVEQMIQKAEIYDPSYRKTLTHQFSKLFPKSSLTASQLILGNYTEEKDLHNRPMAKFMMDIGRQLRLIK